MTWIALAIAIVFVFVGAFAQRRLFAVWQLPVFLSRRWMRYLIMAIVVFAFGVPSMNGYPWLAPIYGFVLGILGGKQELWIQATKDHHTGSTPKGS